MQHKNTFFTSEPVDDFSVLNYLLKNVRGLSPSSLAPAYITVDDTQE